MIKTNDVQGQIDFAFHATLVLLGKNRNIKT